ncbi:uncharacterized protein LOC141665808 [Apium graveolens]|uniref:uncharacterized protein LOC141665808 n=1 Tax=Apium graveolens TaxID=4045 RepID=UPI003D7B809C
MGLSDTIKERNKTSEQDKAKAMIFLRHHLDEGLKTEYLTIKYPSILWKDLKERYDHQKNDNKTVGRGRGRGCGYGHERERGRARGHGFVHGRGRNQQNPPNFKKKPYYHKRTINKEKSEESTMVKRGESTYRRCGMKGHWRSTCRTSKHFADLYQASLKNVETNFTEQNDPLGIAHLEAHLGSADQVDPSAFTHMEVGDFFEDVDVNIPKFGGDEPKNN